jgi:hypothetical protein
MKKTCTLFLLAIVSFSLIGQNAKSHAVILQAKIQLNPAKITLQWQEDSAATESSYIVYRKAVDDKLWGTALATLPASARTYEDTNVELAKVYEYYVQRTYSTSMLAHGYITAAIGLKEVMQRGRMLVLVSENYRTDLSDEIDVLQQDLIKDGWVAKVIYVDPASSVADIKSMITTQHNLNPLEGVFLIGKIAIPYSGDIAPDAHVPDHKGAWPADMYYGTLNNTYWTDNTINVTAAASPKQHNIPGDGKFDQNLVYPETVQLQIGRLFLDDMPAFSDNDTMLTKSYLQRLHRFKTAAFKPVNRALVDDNFGVMSGEAFAASAWRSFSTIVGDSLHSKDYLSSLRNESYLMAYGCGAGSYTSAGGVANTNQIAASDSLSAIVHSLFGSYFGDWDKSNNFLRAPLCAKGNSGLASIWSGRPHWHLHHLAMGWNMGYSTRLTQNNVWGAAFTVPENSGYVHNVFPTFVHIALMGDPSLRLHYLKPIASLTALPSTDSIRIQLSWQSSADATDGYVILRSQSLDQPFRFWKKVDAGVTSLTDTFPYFGENYYMVRAMKLEQTPSGSYYNLALGEIASTFSINPTGINTILARQMQVKLFPNPSSGAFQIDAADIDFPMDVSVFDITGKLILKSYQVSPQTVIQLPETVQGIFFVQLNSKDANTVQKLIVSPK